jgi:chemosensory pili system protein ChpC
MEWRGLGIPLISFERIFGLRGGSAVRNSRAIILNTLNGNRQLPFVAILSQRIPRLLLVTARMLKTVNNAPAQEGILSRVEIQGEHAMIPDIDKMEQLLLRHGVKVDRMTGSNH